MMTSAAAFGTHAASTQVWVRTLANAIRSADLKMGRLLDQIDLFVDEHGLSTEVEAADRPAPTRLPDGPLTEPVSEFGSVIWATGFLPQYPWLPDAVLDAKGSVVHHGGVMKLPGLYILGLPLLRCRTRLGRTGRTTSPVTSPKRASQPQPQPAHLRNDPAQRRYPDPTGGADRRGGGGGQPVAIAGRTDCARPRGRRPMTT